MRLLCRRVGVPGVHPRPIDAMQYRSVCSLDWRHPRAPGILIAVLIIYLLRSRFVYSNLGVCLFIRWSRVRILLIFWSAKRIKAVGLPVSFVFRLYSSLVLYLVFSVVFNACICIMYVFNC